ncbi:MAG: CinA family nicotinamide mononucleotide deamidase-related protein, partial [Bacteroidales bacterium]
MKAEVITIGDELLIGQVIDTNSAWIGKELNKTGIELFRITSVGDDKEDMLRILHEAGERSDIILITGGIGPTKDDKTKQVLSDFFGMQLRFDQDSYNNVERIFHARGREVNELSRTQAMVLDGATIIQNKKGTAPVSWIEKDNKVFVSMPGVPTEMKWVMSEEIIPRLQQRFQPDDVILHRTFLIKDFTESGLAEFIAGWENALDKKLSLAYLPSPGIVRLRLTYRGKGNKDTGIALLEGEALKLKQLLSNALFEDEDLPIGAYIGKILKQKKLTFATAESCTGGYIAHQTTAISGSSAYFKGGIIAYSNEVKENLLCVKSETLLNFGAVSRQV